jgi:hypothetical protein
MKTLVISAYPCCGKSYAFKNYQESFSILDSDSSDFSWIYTENGEKVRNPEFPQNYISHIKENLGKVDVIFVSSHLAVRQAMTEEGIHYYTVYPERGFLKEWIRRMESRGSSEEFICFQATHWYEFMSAIENEPHGAGLYTLGQDDYLNIDAIWKLYVINKREMEGNK